VAAESRPDEARVNFDGPRTLARAGQLERQLIALDSELVVSLQRSSTGGAVMCTRSCRRETRWLAAAALAVLPTTLPAQRSGAPSEPPPTVIAIGCVAQHPDTASAPPTGHEQGAALGLTLARATLKTADGRTPSTAPRSAVPGSLPAGTNSGTTPEAAAANAQAPVEQSFWLVGAKTPELLRALDKRVEVTGTVDERLSANPGTARVTDTGAAAARRSTSAPADSAVTAHPSAPTRAISVESFRVVGDRCT
jgi:hypothetical protein